MVQYYLCYNKTYISNIEKKYKYYYYYKIWTSNGKFISFSSKLETHRKQRYKYTFSKKFEILNETLLSYVKTIFCPDHNQYDKNSNWKAIGDKYGFEVSKDCENWYKAGLIKAKDDIVDYYLMNYSKVMKHDKIDPEWNDFVDYNPKLNLTKNQD